MWRERGEEEESEDITHNLQWSKTYASKQLYGK
jgi:hypothetical protein